MIRRLAIAVLVTATAAVAQNYENNANNYGGNYNEQGNDYEGNGNYENNANYGNYGNNTQGNYENYENNANYGNYGNNAQGNYGNYGNQDNAVENANLNADFGGNGVSNYGTNYGGGNTFGGGNYAPTNNTATGNFVNGGTNYAPTNAAVPEAAPAPETPAAPPSPFPPGPKELSFQIDQNGTLSLHRFILKWPSPDANLQFIDVINSETDELVQTISIPQDRVRLVYQEIMHYRKGGDQLKDKIVDLKDYNFDNYGDLRLLAKWPYRVGEKQYLVMIFHPLDLKYRINDAISALKAPLPNPKTYRIESTTLQGWGGGEYTTDFYSIDKQGRLTLQKRYSHTILDRIRGSFTRDVRLRVGGELQRVCKIFFPAEGVPRRVWGNKHLCQKFAKKEDRK